MANAAEAGVAIDHGCRLLSNGYRAPWRLVESTDPAAEFLLALVFPVVPYPSWMESMNRSQGPAEKSVLWITGAGDLCFGRVSDQSSWCARGDWHELVRAAKAEGQTKLHDLHSRRFWHVEAFQSHPSFRVFSAESGALDPWRALEWAIEQVLARAEVRTTQGTSNGQQWSIAKLAYANAGRSEIVGRNRRQALALFPADVLQAELDAATRPSRLAMVLSAIDQGLELVPAMAEWLGCRGALVRHLFAHRSEVPVSVWQRDAALLRLIVPIIEAVPPEKWPRKDSDWSFLIKGAQRLRQAYEPSKVNPAAPITAILAGILFRGIGPSSGTTLTDHETLACELQEIEECTPEVLLAAASMSMRRLDLLLDDMERAKRSPVDPQQSPAPSFPGVLKSLALAAQRQSGALRIVAPASLNACVTWGTRVGNCLRNPDTAIDYIHKGKLILFLSKFGRPRATIALAEAPVARRSRLRLIELREHGGTLSQEELELLAESMCALEDRLKSMSMVERLAESEAWSALARKRADDRLDREQIACRRVLREWVRQVVAGTM